MKPKVCLVNPGVFKDYNCYFPVGLGYIAASCVKSSIDVVVIDPNAMGLDFNETVDRILASGSKVVGITGLLLQLKYSMSLTKAIKQKSPDTFIIMGGFQTIGIEETILKYCPVDLILRGEVETIFPEVVHRLYTDKNVYDTEGAVYRKGDDIIFNEKIPIMENINDIERPLYELFPMKKYIGNFYFGNYGKNTFFIIGSRGCAFHCSFCVNSKRIVKLRYRNPEHVRDEIRFLKTNYGVNDLFVIDENITSNKIWLKDVAEILHSENISWVAMTRADMLDDHTLEIFKSNGCQRLIMGIESGSDLALEKMNKKVTTKTYQAAFAQIRKYGIGIQSNFIIGMPDDTMETFRETERFCIENGLVYGPNFLLPFPGTVLYDQVRDRLPHPLEYIDRLWETEFRRTPTVNVSRFSDATLTRIRTMMLLNTASNLVSKRIKFVPLVVIKQLFRAFLLFFDNAHHYPKVALKLDYIINIYRQHFNK